MMRIAVRPAAQHGFSLVEIALVLVIISILLSAATVPLASLEGQRRERRLQADLSSVRDALIAHMVSHGALPCPVGPVASAGPLGSTSAPAGAGGQRSAVATHGRCATFRGGVPAAALSVAGAVDAAGALLDPWGRAYRFALSDADDGTPGLPDWSVPGEPGAVGIERLRGSLSVCERPAARCPRGALRANDLVFVVLSHGADAGGDGLQRQNLAPGGSFTLAPRSEVPATRFDDALVWASRSELVWWMLRAGRLP